MRSEAYGTVVDGEVSGVEDDEVCGGDDIDGDVDGAGKVAGG